MSLLNSQFRASAELLNPPAALDLAVSSEWLGDIADVGASGTN